MASESRRSALSWITIIALGVMLGNGLTSFTERLYTQYHLDGLPGNMKELGKLFDKPAPGSAEELQDQQKRNRTQAQLEANCEYWEEQAESIASTQNRTFRDMACARAKGMFR